MSKSPAKKNRASHTPKSYPRPSTLAAKKYEAVPEGHPTRPNTLAMALGESEMLIEVWRNSMRRRTMMCAARLVRTRLPRRTESLR